jgi:hypothetical protein
LALAVVYLVSMAAVSLTDQSAVTFESDIIQLFDFDYERSLPT